jgi:glucokinase
MKEVLAVDIGGRYAKIALIDQCCKLKNFYKLPTGYHSRPEDVLSKLAKKKLAICIAGTVKDNYIYDNPNLLRWRKLDLRKLLGSNVLVENDADAAAFGEWYWEEKKAKILVSLTLGSGVGSGIVIKGKLYKGAQGFGAELGHMVIDKNGNRCRCGSRGCLETLVSEKFIKTEARKVFGTSYSPKRVAELAETGDNKALKIFEAYGRNLGIGISNIANIFNPDLVVLAGGLSKSYKFFSKAMYRAFKASAMKSLQDLRIKPSKFNELAGVFGIAALYFRKCQL